jgi:diaminopimelate epimerase
VNVSGTGVTVAVGSIVVNGTGTQITATFVVASNASQTARNVTVTTPGGTSTPPPTVTFTVN